MLHVDKTETRNGLSIGTGLFPDKTEVALLGFGDLFYCLNRDDGVILFE